MILLDDKLQKLTGSGIVYGDKISISTIKGEKSIVLTRNGVRKNILNCLRGTIYLPMLLKVFRIYS